VLLKFAGAYIHLIGLLAATAAMSTAAALACVDKLDLGLYNVPVCRVHGRGCYFRPVFPIVL